MAVATRFAPSPTGRLHVGNMRTAVMNWLCARRAGGRFVLRLDDTDRERSTEAFAEGIRADMAWLGLDADEEVRQSRRLDRYETARARLAGAGRLYPCYETAEELETRRRLNRAQGLPPVYDRAALKLSEPERARLEEEGRRPHWRFRLSGEAVAFDDLIRGPQRFEPGHVSDPVLVREDGQPTYTLASVVDDIEMGISHVIRGEDHVANTAVQIELIAALGGASIVFAHHPLMTGPGGEKLSKRDAAVAVADLRADGLEPEAVVSLLARIGTSDPVEPVHDRAALVEGFDLAKVSRNPPRYDPVELAQLNARWLHEAAHAEVAGKLEAIGLGEVPASFWDAVRGNLEKLSEAGDWWRICTGEIEPVVEDAELLAAAGRLLPREPWDESTWPAWTAAVKAQTGRKGRALFMPLRLALTGLDHGPELKALLPFIGRARALARLGMAN